MSQTLSAAAPSPHAETPPVAELWEAMRANLDAAFSMFGAPKVLAEKAWLPRAAYRACCSWLYRCEELLRRLIFIMALPLLALASGSRSSARRARAARARTFDPEHPARWPVSFALRYGGPPRQSAKAKSAVKPRAPVVNALPLARRLEALRRAVLLPLAPALRLARLMRRHGNVAAIARKLARPTLSYLRRKMQPGDLAIAEAARCVRDIYAPNTS